MAKKVEKKREKKYVPKGTIARGEQPVRKTFSYVKDGVALEFTLRVDIKKELKAWLDLMEVARLDIIKEINGGTLPE
jgi:hypothetical protein